jgi:uncharacterized protein
VKPRGSSNRLCRVLDANGNVADPSTPPIQEAAGTSWRARLARPRRGPWLQFFTIAGFEYNQLDLTLPELPDALKGLRLLYLTDLHLRAKWDAGLDALLERAKSNPPDLILYGGDQAHHMHRLESAFPTVRRLVSELASRYGSFGVLGNHDGDLFGPILNSWGVRMIGHDRVDVPINGKAVELIGFPGPARRDFDEVFVRRLPPKRPQVPRIILSHYPDLIRHCTDLKPDLYLAGHTHGGQICLPGEIPIIKHDSLPRRYTRGLHEFHDMCICVSRGMGFSGFIRARMFCPAEAIEIRLHRDAG